jgi:hypothetical protein
MGLIYGSTVRTPRMNVVRDLIDSKTIGAATGAGSAGSLVIGTSALSGATGVLATITLPNPASTVSGDVLTLAGVPLSATASASGTANKAEIRNNAGTVIVGNLSVGTSASDVIVNTTTVTSGQTVTVTSGTVTHNTTGT